MQHQDPVSSANQEENWLTWLHDQQALLTHTLYSQLYRIFQRYLEPHASAQTSPSLDKANKLDDDVWQLTHLLAKQFAPTLVHDLKEVESSQSQVQEPIETAPKEQITVLAHHPLIKIKKPKMPAIVWIATPSAKINLKSSAELPNPLTFSSRYSRHLHRLLYEFKQTEHLKRDAEYDQALREGCFPALHFLKKILEVGLPEKNLPQLLKQKMLGDTADYDQRRKESIGVIKAAYYLYYQLLRLLNNVSAFAALHQEVFNFKDRYQITLSHELNFLNKKNVKKEFNIFCYEFNRQYLEALKLVEEFTVEINHLPQDIQAQIDTIKHLKQHFQEEGASGVTSLEEKVRFCVSAQANLFDTRQNSVAQLTAINEYFSNKKFVCEEIKKLRHHQEADMADLIKKIEVIKRNIFILKEKKEQAALLAKNTFSKKIKTHTENMMATMEIHNIALTKLIDSAEARKIHIESNAKLNEISKLNKTDVENLVNHVMPALADELTHIANDFEPLLHFLEKNCYGALRDACIDLINHKDQGLHTIAQSCLSRHRLEMEKISKVASQFENEFDQQHCAVLKQARLQLATQADIREIKRRVSKKLRQSYQEKFSSLQSALSQADEVIEVQEKIFNDSIPLLSIDDIAKLDVAARQLELPSLQVEKIIEAVLQEASGKINHILIKIENHEENIPVEIYKSCIVDFQAKLKEIESELDLPNKCCALLLLMKEIDSCYREINVSIKSHWYQTKLGSFRELLIATQQDLSELTMLLSSVAQGGHWFDVVSDQEMLKLYYQEELRIKKLLDSSYHITTLNLALDNIATLKENISKFLKEMHAKKEKATLHLRVKEAEIRLEKVSQQCLELQSVIARDLTELDQHLHEYATIYPELELTNQSKTERKNHDDEYKEILDLLKAYHKRYVPLSTQLPTEQLLEQFACLVDEIAQLKLDINVFKKVNRAYAYMLRFQQLCLQFDKLPQHLFLHCKQKPTSSIAIAIKNFITTKDFLSNHQAGAMDHENDYQANIRIPSIYLHHQLIDEMHKQIQFITLNLPTVSVSSHPMTLAQNLNPVGKLPKIKPFEGLQSTSKLPRPVG